MVLFMLEVEAGDQAPLAVMLVMEEVEEEEMGQLQDDGEVQNPEHMEQEVVVEEDLGMQQQVVLEPQGELE